MARFTDLPPELMDAIAADTSLRDRSSLSKTCRSIRSFTLPALFQECKVSGERFSVSNPAVKLNAFLRRLQKSQGLERHVRSIEVEETERYMESVRLAELKKLEEETWTADPDLITATGLLVSQCAQSLQHLWLSTSRNDQLKAIFPQDPDDTDQILRFGKLTHVSVCRNATQDRSEKTENEYLLFYLPALKELNMFNCQLANSQPSREGLARIQSLPGRFMFNRPLPNFQLSWPLPKPPAAINLTTLRLTSVQLTPEGLSFVLDSAPNITTLEYHCILEAIYTPFNCTRLRKSLARYQDTLKDLSIDLEVEEDQGYEVMHLGSQNIQNVFLGHLGSLRDFHALTYLQVPLTLLYGQEDAGDLPLLADLLPPHLQVLSLSRNLWALVRPLWDALGLMETVLQFLSGETKVVDPKWNGSEAYRELGDVSWVKSGEPGWRSATPELKTLELNVYEQYNEDDNEDEENEDGYGRYYFFWRTARHTDKIQRASKEQGLQCCWPCSSHVAPCFRPPPLAGSESPSP